VWCGAFGGSGGSRTELWHVYAGLLKDQGIPEFGSFRCGQQLHLEQDCKPLAPESFSETMDALKKDPYSNAVCFGLMGGRKRVPRATSMPHYHFTSRACLGRCSRFFPNSREVSGLVALWRFSHIHR
jgi:hypothetical protein